MASQFCLHFVALLAAIISVCWAQENLPMVTLQVSPAETVEAGATLTITCMAENFGAGRIVKLLKYQPDAVAEVTLFSNNAIETVYEDIDRFSLVVVPTFPDEPDRPAYTFTFTINGALTQDSGTYRCEITGSDAQANRKIDVTEPATMIKLYVGNEEGELAVDVDGQEVEMDGTRRNIRCRVWGGNPAADVVIRAAGEDITSLFTPLQHVEMHETGGPAGMVRPEVELELNSADSTGIPMLYKYNKQAIGCYAYYNDNEILSSYFTPVFQGVKPEFVSCPREVLAYRYQQDINITCSLVANPPPDDCSISYSLRNKSIVETIGMDESDGQYSTELKEADGEFQMILYIANAAPQVFREYTFKAQNDMGESEHVVELKRDPNDVSDNGASALAALPLVLLLALQFLLC